MRWAATPPPPQQQKKLIVNGKGGEYKTEENYLTPVSIVTSLQWLLHTTSIYNYVRRARSKRLKQIPTFFFQLIIFDK